MGLMCRAGNGCDFVKLQRSREPVGKEGSRGKWVVVVGEGRVEGVGGEASPASGPPSLITVNVACFFVVNRAKTYLFA